MLLKPLENKVLAQLPLDTEILLVTPKGSSAVLAKLSSAGGVLWISQHFGEASCLFHELACDAQGRV
ncbi:MAG: hypothetical protein K8U03_18245 [Planctomycetia bacterium]|nr:hypothetical protein [Planctomycetia bacterium]